MKSNFLQKTILLSLFVLLWIQIQSQDYHPMPVSEAQWHITRCWGFYPGGWHDEYFVEMDGSDTVINSRVYKKLYLTTHHLPGTEHDSIYTHFLGGMRESGKQIFFISEYLCLDTIERMLYDFNEAVIGDTIFTQVLTNGLTQFIPHIVTSVDSVQVGDDFHRRIHLRDENDFFTEYWIEGVGSSLGLIYASYWLLTDNSYDLNCFYSEGQLEFTNMEPAYGFCLAPLPVIECDSTTAIPNDPEKYIAYIYPNPAIGIIHIESNVSFEKIRVLNTYGQKVMERITVDELNVHALYPGVYILQLMSNTGKVLVSEKFVKI